MVSCLHDLNEEVEVILNEHGLRVLNDYWAEAYAVCPEAPRKTERKQRMPLWQLMQIFGPVISHGMRQSPFIGNRIAIGDTPLDRIKELEAEIEALKRPDII